MPRSAKQVSSYRYEGKQYTELRFVIFFFQQTAENLASAGAFSLLLLLFVVGAHSILIFISMY